MASWETAIRTAAAKCDFGTSADTCMRDKFLFGLHEEYSMLRQEIFFRDARRKADERQFTFAEVVSQAAAFEAATHASRALAPSNPDDCVHRFTAAAAKPTPPPRQQQRQPALSAWKCYTCGSTDRHDRKSCPAAKATCSYCGIRGHFATVCRKKARATARPGTQRDAIHALTSAAAHHVHTAVDEHTQSAAPPTEDCF